MDYRFPTGAGLFAAFALTVGLLTPPSQAFSAQKSAPAQPKQGAEQKSPPPQGNTTPASTPEAEQAGEKAAWSVRMSKDAPHTFTIKAKDARLSEIAAELSKLLKAPVQLSPVMESQRVNLDFGGMNLEGALRMMAPQVFVDYVAGGEDTTEAKPLAIYLQAYNERPPALTATMKGNSEAILIEGDTEEGVGTEEEQRKREEAEPLKVTYTNYQLSVRARRQPLTVVLYRIAGEVGVAFEMKYESPEVVDVDFSNYSFDHAVRSISPLVRFYYRLDLQTFQLQPLRIALVAPDGARD